MIRVKSSNKYYNIRSGKGDGSFETSDRLRKINPRIASKLFSNGFWRMSFWWFSNSCRGQPRRLQSIGTHNTRSVGFVFDSQLLMPFESGVLPNRPNRSTRRAVVRRWSTWPVAAAHDYIGRTVLRPPHISRRPRVEFHYKNNRVITVRRAYCFSKNLQTTHAWDRNTPKYVIRFKSRATGPVRLGNQRSRLLEHSSSSRTTTTHRDRVYNTVQRGSESVFDSIIIRTRRFTLCSYRDGRYW